MRIKQFNFAIQVAGMKLILSFLCVLSFVFLRPVHLQAQTTEFTATISPASIYQNEYATLRIEIKNAKEIQKLTPPVLHHFVVVSGPNQETGMLTVNGKINQYVAFSYIIQPKNVNGKINLGQAVATIDGKGYTSKPLFIEVKKGRGSSARQNPAIDPFALHDPFDEQESQPEKNEDIQLKKGEIIQDKIARNMFVKLETNKHTCYVGEALVASYNLYSRLKSETKLVKNPSFNGFSVIDLQQPNATDYAQRIINGKEFNVYTIRKVQLYPLQAGTFQLESASLDNQVQFLKPDADPSLQGDFFNSMIINPDDYITQQVTLSSNTETITVKPLPAGKPASFSGAVGQFQIESSLAKNNFTTNESGKLQIYLSGSGNMPFITAPVIEWPKNIDGFDAKLTDQLNQLDVPVSGRKLFEYPFTVNKPGTYTIPEIEFSYFDPAVAAYKTCKSKPINFTVTPGLPASGATPITTKQEELSPLNKLFENRPLVITLIAAILMAGLIVWLRKDKKQELQNKQVAIEAGDEQPGYTAVPEQQQNPLQESETCLHDLDCSRFYFLLNKELKSFLADTYHLSSSIFSATAVAVAMDKAGIANDVILQMHDLINEIERNLYTPGNHPGDRSDLYSRSLDLIQLVSEKNNKFNQ